LVRELRDLLGRMESARSFRAARNAILERDLLMENETTMETIKGWVLEGKSDGATHVVIMRDTFDGSTSPINVMPGEDVHGIAVDNKEKMEKVVEVYNLVLNIDDQLQEYRAMNL
jgi:hypothetical protein